MKVIFAISALPGEVSGAGCYANNLKKELEKKGLLVEVVSYKKIVKLPQPFKLFSYFLQLFKKAKKADLIYSFNLISTGLPACWAGFLAGKKFIVRLGGDYLWERAFEKGRTTKTLRDYYQEKKGLKERGCIFCINFVLKRANKIIFTTNFQRQIYLKNYKLAEEKTAVIENPFPENVKCQITNDKSDKSMSNAKCQILYAGRFLKLKNLAMLLDVFAQVLEKTEKPLTLKLVGQGPEENNLKFKVQSAKLEDKVKVLPSLPQKQLFQEIAKSWLCVLPSLTDISPNFALEAIALGTPLLLTKETGLYERFKNHLIFFDPHRPRELQIKLSALLDPASYNAALAMVKNIDKTHSWDRVVEAHLSILNQL